jgi:hypothetical protein
VEQGISTTQTIVLLGASNLTRGISTVVETLHLQHQAPLRIVTALGFGRSYGLRSSVLGRSLSSILECGVWDAIARDPNPPSFALLSDVGNDVMYGVEPHIIVAWIDNCIDRLRNLPGGGVRHVNLTALPVDSIARVKPWHFKIVKSILFPSHAIRFEQAIARAAETQQRLEELASRRAPLVKLVPHDGDWYGFDPIHIKRRHWSSAWSRFLAHDDLHELLRARGSITRWRRLRLHMPEHYAIFGRSRFCPQPLTLNNQISVEMF